MSIGIWQVLLVLLIVLILFGAGKLPTIMGDLGKGIRNFKAGLRTDDKPETPPEPGPQRIDAPLPEPAKDETRTR